MSKNVPRQRGLSAKVSDKRGPRPRAARQLRLVLVGFTVGLAALAMVIYAVLPPPSRSPQIGGSFALVNQEGETVTSKDLIGHPYLVFFGYTHCPDFCPTTLLDISSVFKELGADKKISALFVTLDPERDKPEVLKTYLENFDGRIIGLTGDPQTIEAVAQSFRVYVKKVPGQKPGDYTVDHTGVVYLMDKRGKFVSAFNLQRPPQQVVRELQAYL